MMSEFGSAMITPAGGRGAPQLPAQRRLPVGGRLRGATYAWQHWVGELRKILPASEYPIVDVPLNHSILHTLFDAKRDSADSGDR